MDESRLITLGRKTSSGLLSNSPCFVYSICGIGLAEPDNVYTIHDGQSTAGDVIMRLVAGSYCTDFRLYAAPLYFSKGLYVEFTTNGEEVFVQFLELKR